LRHPPERPETALPGGSLPEMPDYNNQNQLILQASSPARVTRQNMQMYHFHA